MRRAYVEELLRCRYSETSLEQARHVLGRLFSHLNSLKVTDLRAVTEAHLISFARHIRQAKSIRGGPLSHWSQHTYLALVRRFFAFLDRRSLILRDPARDVSFPTPDRLPRHVLTVREAHRLVGAPLPDTRIGRRDRALLETLYGAGLRAGECSRLDQDDVDLTQRSLLVRNGKGRKDRVLPIPGRARLALQAYLSQSRPELVHDPRQRALFLTYAGARIGTAAIRVMVAGHARAVGITRKVYPHVLRHSFATHLLQGGADVRHVQQLLGHQDIQTTTIYTRVNLTDLRRVLAKAHPRERQGRGRHRMR